VPIPHSSTMVVVVNVVVDEVMVKASVNSTKIRFLLRQFTSFHLSVVAVTTLEQESRYVSVNGV